MKRITWIPVVASVVLLLVAVPLFASDIVNVVHPETKAETVLPMREGLNDLDFSGDDYEQRGSGCESSGEITNPF